MLLVTLTASAAPFVSSQGYSFTPAPGWKVRQDMRYMDAVAFPIHSGKDFCVFTASVSPDKMGGSLENRRKWIATTYPRLYTGFQILSSKIDNWANPHVLGITGRYRQGPQTLRMRQSIVQHEGRLYTFTDTAPEASHARYDAAVTQMLRSVKWSQ